MKSHELKLRHSPEGELAAFRDGSWVTVRIVQCFPWLAPGEWYSVREGDEEVCLIQSLESLDPVSRAALEESLAESGFLFDVTGIEEQVEEYELRRWKVRTLQGPRVFQTGIDEWPRKLPEGGLLFRDVSGDFYRIRDPKILDPASRRKLWAFLD